MASVLGIERAAVLDGVPIQEISCGLPFVFVPLKSRAAVDECVLDPRANEAMFKEAGLPRRNILVFSVEPGDDHATVYSRMLGTGREDPATGSAAAVSLRKLRGPRLPSRGTAGVPVQGMGFGADALSRSLTEAADS